MKQIITGWDHIFGPWLMEQTGGTWTAGRGSTIGLVDIETQQIHAAVVFSDCNNRSIVLHCAGVGGKWLNRKFLWFVFYYPFTQLGVDKIISPVESSNIPSRKFIEHIGFELEATLKDCSPQGDLLLYTLSRENCKWLSLKDQYRGQTLPATAA